MLLHCYPYHRQAGALAQAYPHVYLDVGMALHYVGARAGAVLAESLELAPFGKVLFSSDAAGPAELHYLGTLLWRRATADVLGGWAESGDWSADDAIRVAEMIGVGRPRVYRLLCARGPVNPGPRPRQPKRKPAGRRRPGTGRAAGASSGAHPWWRGAPWQSQFSSTQRGRGRRGIRQAAHRRVPLGTGQAAPPRGVGATGNAA
jgi:hypothetical protein